MPTRNRSGLLRRALGYLAAVDYPTHDFEIIVVDTASTDDTRAVCEQLRSDGLRNLRYEYCDRPGLHVGRHRGAKVAASDILLFADDDIRPSATWLRGVSEGFRDGKAAMVGGNNLPECECAPPPWFESLWRECEHGRYLGPYSLIDFGETPKTIPPSFVWGCNFGIRRSVLIQAGGFHPDSMPKSLVRYSGDGEVAVGRAVLALGLKCRFEPSATVSHWVSKERMTLDYLRHRGFTQGIDFSFRRLRSFYGVGQNPSWRERYSEFLGSRWRRAKRHLKQLLAGAGAGGPAIGAYVRGQMAGLTFHEQETQRDPLLLRWVLRPDYWDESASPRGECRLAE